MKAFGVTLPKLPNCQHFIPAQGALSATVCVAANVLGLAQAAAITTIAMRAVTLVAAASLICDALNSSGLTSSLRLNDLPLLQWIKPTRKEEDFDFNRVHFLALSLSTCSLALYYFGLIGLPGAQFGLLCMATAPAAVQYKWVATHAAASAKGLVDAVFVKDSNRGGGAMTCAPRHEGPGAYGHSDQGQGAGAYGGYGYGGPDQGAYDEWPQ